VVRLLLLGLVLAGVWYLYRMVTRHGQTSPAAADLPPGEGAEAARAANEAAAEPAEEELQECPVCRAYLPQSASDGCGRPDCPVPALAAARAEGASGAGGA